MLSCADIRMNFTALFWHRTRERNPFELIGLPRYLPRNHTCSIKYIVYNGEPIKFSGTKLCCRQHIHWKYKTIDRNNFAFIRNGSYCPGDISAIKLSTQTVIQRIDTLKRTKSNRSISLRLINRSRFVIAIQAWIYMCNRHKRTFLSG